MNKVQNGIAIALAIVVVAAFFIFPGLWPFPKATAPATAATASTTDQTTNPQSPMPEASSTTQLQVNDETVGTGAVAEPGDTVTVNYVGAFTDGTVFDASANHPETKNGFTFTLGAGNVIKGWDEGVAGMKVGGKRILVVPPSLGYGSQDYGPIPGNSTLVFEVELLNVQNPR